MQDDARLTAVIVEVSINCEDLIGHDGINVLDEFIELGNEVTFYTDVTVTKDVTQAYTYHELAKEIKELKRKMEQKKRMLLERIHNGQKD